MSSDVKRWARGPAGHLLHEYESSCGTDALKAELDNCRELSNLRLRDLTTIAATVERVKALPTLRVMNTEVVRKVDLDAALAAPSVGDKTDRRYCAHDVLMAHRCSECERLHGTAPSVPTRDGGRSGISDSSPPDPVVLADPTLLTPVTTRPGPSPVGGTKGACACPFWNATAVSTCSCCGTMTGLPHSHPGPYTGPERRARYWRAYGYVVDIDDVHMPVFMRPDGSLHANTRAAKGGGK